mmetsp:Transcript_52614/g.119900  ORF Transcript_52614/g.119900 Transcript_52614/m.119900 type:complete len:276 (-) Transcript_52614:144-971(-)
MFKNVNPSPVILLHLLSAMVDAGVSDHLGVVRLNVTAAEVEQALLKVSGNSATEVAANQSAVVGAVRRGVYSNMYGLLGNQLSEQEYLDTVANQVLVDVQEKDVLFQIFTSNVLQAKPTEEAPFFEFIQRKCGEARLADGTFAPMRAGCGGFGIRNFLTLFLSIEVSQAMVQLQAATAVGNHKRADIAKEQIALYEEQLEKSNPVLTAISEAMTAEADWLEAATRAATEADKTTATAKAEECRQEKESWKDQLVTMGEFYKTKTTEIRARAAAAA